jgi:single-strand DNA-binding protein
MADGLNSVMLLGNIGKTPVLRFTNDGTGALNFDIATTSSYLDRNKERQERTDWHHVVVWGKRAEALSKILHSGSKLFISGSLRTSKWEHNGENHYKTEVVAENVILCGSKAPEERPDDFRKPEQSKSAEPYPF